MSAGPTGRSYWVVPGRFAAGAYPSTRVPGPDGRIEVIERLLAAGIDDFVNLTQDRPGGTDEHLRHYDEAVSERGTVSRFEIPDLGIPTIEKMTAILDHLDEQLDAGRSVYVHCWGGIGRTGTVVGCWLLRHGEATPDDVLAVIAELRKGDIGAGNRASPETEEQRAFLRAWPIDGQPSQRREHDGP